MSKRGLKARKLNFFTKDIGNSKLSSIYGRYQEQPAKFNRSARGTKNRSSHKDLFKILSYEKSYIPAVTRLNFS